MYLKKFTLLDVNQEYAILCDEQRRVFVNQYPLKIFTQKEYKDIEFNNITIFYGGNGSGKTTLINIIAERLNANRKSSMDKGTYFDLYVKYCKYEMGFSEPSEIKLVTSDDVFEYLLDIRAINARVNRNKEILCKEYLNFKYDEYANNFDNYEELKNNMETKKKSMSRYVRERLGNNNIVEQSNGESALMFWEREIKENGIYILDEPENSLSAENQLKLKHFIEESERFYNCQFIISTHSPFLLNLNNAIIYDLDEIPVIQKKWTDLSNVRVYYNFFKEHESEFK